MIVFPDIVQKLSYAQTVPCAVAHRRALGEVFVADSVADDNGDVYLALQLPRAHSLWFDRTVPFHDTFSTAEAARQASFVMVHRHLGVEVGLPFTLQNFDFRVPAVAPYADGGREPLEAVLRYRIAEQRMRGDEFGELTLHGEMTIDGAPAMSLVADLVFLGREDYKALRAFQISRKPRYDSPPAPARPLDPAAVGRLDRRNVVIGEPDGAGRFPLVIDRTHPSFFDHDYDHVPGPFIVEGLRQAGLVTAVRAGALRSPQAAVTRCRVQFHTFAEFDAPLELTARVEDGAGPVTAVAQLTQGGKPVAEAEIGLTPYAAVLEGGPAGLTATVPSIPGGRLKIEHNGGYEHFEPVGAATYRWTMRTKIAE